MDREVLAKLQYSVITSKEQPDWAQYQDYEDPEHGPDHLDDQHKLYHKRLSPRFKQDQARERHLQCPTVPNVYMRTPT